MFNKLLNLYNDHTNKVNFGAGALVGLIIGLIFAWMIWPTSFYNTTPESLRSDIRDDVLVLIARDYVATGNVAQAQMRLGLEYWKKDPAEMLDELAQARGGSDGAALAQLAQVARMEIQPIGTPEEPVSLLQKLKPAFQVCGAGLIVAAIAGLAYVIVSRRKSERPA